MTAWMKDHIWAPVVLSAFALMLCEEAIKTISRWWHRRVERRRMPRYYR